MEANSTIPLLCLTQWVNDRIVGQTSRGVRWFKSSPLESTTSDYQTASSFCAQSRWKKPWARSWEKATGWMRFHWVTKWWFLRSELDQSESLLLDHRKLMVQDLIQVWTLSRIKPDWNLNQPSGIISGLLNILHCFKWFRNTGVDIVARLGNNASKFVLLEKS